MFATFYLSRLSGQLCNLLCKEDQNLLRRRLIRSIRLGFVQPFRVGDEGDALKIEAKTNTTFCGIKH